VSFPSPTPSTKGLKLRLSEMRESSKHNSSLGRTRMRMLKNLKRLLEVKFSMELALE